MSVKSLQSCTMEEQLDFADCDEAKDKGNQYFAKQEYSLATRCYTKALDLCKDNKSVSASVFYKNRAACYLKMVSSINLINRYASTITLIYNALFYSHMKYYCILQY